MTSPKKRIEAQMKTIEATVILLKQKSGATQLGALDLFYFLGCFSNGIAYESLSKIWPNNTLDESLYLFEKLGLLELSSTRKSLNRFLTNFVETSNFEHLNPILMTLIIKHYTELLESLHNRNVP